MTENRLPENARASPKEEKKIPRLNTRFEKGGEFLVWERVEIVDEVALPISTSKEDQGVGASDADLPNKSGQISIMLVLQILTLIVSIVALFVAS